MKRNIFTFFITLTIGVIGSLLFILLQGSQVNQLSGTLFGTKNQLQANTTGILAPAETQEIDNELLAGNLIKPVVPFEERITKKYFGTFITPETSPVQPDRFNGFHNGIDVEFEGVSKSIPVRAITDGKIEFSGWVKGYGGVIVLLHTINDKEYFVLYGHLDTNSLPTKNVQEVKAGSIIGVLGDDYSKETDGGRKHLHFSIRPVEYGLNFRGYVDDETELHEWIDPLSFY